MGLLEWAKKKLRDVGGLASRIADQAKQLPAPVQAVAKGAVKSTPTGLSFAAIKGLINASNYNVQAPIPNSQLIPAPVPNSGFSYSPKVVIPPQIHSDVPEPHLNQNEYHDENGKPSLLRPGFTIEGNGIPGRQNPVQMPTVLPPIIIPGGEPGDEPYRKWRNTEGFYANPFYGDGIRRTLIRGQYPPGQLL